MIETSLQKSPLPNITYLFITDSRFRSVTKVFQSLMFHMKVVSLRMSR